MPPQKQSPRAGCTFDDISLPRREAYPCSVRLFSSRVSVWYRIPAKHLIIQVVQDPSARGCFRKQDCVWKELHLMEGKCDRQRSPWKAKIDKPLPLLQYEVLTIATTVQGEAPVFLHAEVVHIADKLDLVIDASIHVTEPLADLHGPLDHQLPVKNAGCGMPLAEILVLHRAAIHTCDWLLKWPAARYRLAGRWARMDEKSGEEEAGGERE